MREDDANFPVTTVNSGDGLVLQVLEKVVPAAMLAVAQDIKKKIKYMLDVAQVR